MPDLTPELILIILRFEGVGHAERDCEVVQRYEGFEMPRRGRSRHVRLAATYRLANFKPLELRMIQIQRFVVPCPTMRRHGFPRGVWEA